MVSLIWILTWWWWMPCRWWLLLSNNRISPSSPKWYLKWIKLFKCPRWGILMCHYHRNNKLGVKKRSNWIQKMVSSFRITKRYLSK
jgi:hypothetical protein